GLVIAAILTILGFVRHPVKKVIVAMLGGVLMAIGAMESMLGLMIAGMGRTIEGSIFTIMGIGTTVAGGYALATAAQQAGSEMRLTEFGTLKIVNMLATACQAGTGAMGVMNIMKWK
ncbi:MAG: hypothetical protein PHF00_04035, partial [Elusimicrobia bacterium]|nr:hypothetical protein [Elusimicrobiota bacterium]